METTKKHTSLAFFNDNTKKAFRSLIHQLKKNNLIVVGCWDAEEDYLEVTEEIDILDIMDHCFSCESYTIKLRHINPKLDNTRTCKIWGHLDGCVESMFISWSFPMGMSLIDSVTKDLEKAMDDFNDINEDLDLS